MTGTLQPLDQKFSIVDASGKPTRYFTEWAQQKQMDIGVAITSDDATALIVAYLLAHQLVPGIGIQITPSGNITDNPVIHADAQAILDEITSTRGAILFRGLLGWAALNPGTAGQFLQTAGAGADPIWAAAGGGGGGGLTLLEQHTAAASASLNFTTGISATYDEYIFEFVNVLNATNSAIPWIRMSTNGGVSYDATASYNDEWQSRSLATFSSNGNVAHDKIQMNNNGHVNTFNYGVCGTLHLFSPLSTTQHKVMRGNFTACDGGPSGWVSICDFTGRYMSLTAVNAIQFLFSAGNITSGTIRMFGVAK